MLLGMIATCGAERSERLMMPNHICTMTRADTGSSPGTAYFPTTPRNDTRDVVAGCGPSASVLNGLPPSPQRFLGRTAKG
jgi:hypothetical protein